MPGERSNAGDFRHETMESLIMRSIASKTGMTTYFHAIPRGREMMGISCTKPGGAVFFSMQVHALHTD